MAYMSLHERLKGPIAQALRDDLGITNTNALPRVHKVVVNVGINKSKMDSKEVREYVAKCLGTITGQRPVFTKAKKAISNFKTRQGMVVGASVTLRGRHMEEFLDRLVSYALPRVRDFRGLSAKFDGQGNYSIGLRDHSIFPEIPPVDAKDIFGMQITIATTARNDKHAHALLRHVGMPFKQEKKEESSIESKGKSPDTPNSQLPTPESQSSSQS